MTACSQCPHYSYQHEDVRLGAPCLVTFGWLGDSAFMELSDDETCLCSGFEPGAEVRW